MYIEILKEVLLVFGILITLAIYANRKEKKEALARAIEIFINDPTIDEIQIEKSFGYITIRKEDLMGKDA